MRLVLKRLAHELQKLLALAIILFGGIAFVHSAETNSVAAAHELLTLAPDSNTNLARLVALSDVVAKSDKKAAKAEKKAARSAEDLKNLSPAELQKIFAEPPTRHEARAFTAIGRLAREALNTEDDATRASRVKDIREVQAGIHAAGEPLVPESLGFFSTWVFFFKNMSGTIAHGDTLAANLAGQTRSNSDNGLLDPLPSTFWERPKAIADADLYYGFGRTQFPHLEEAMCEYSAPKVSSGTHGGFDVTWNGERYKVKFGDLNSEPFTARIFYALGFHADPTDYAPSVKVRYNRRILREFHLRQPLNMRIAPLGLTISTVRLQTHYDPFTFITRAVFKDGHEIAGMALKQMLFIHSDISHPEDSPENFRPEVEATLDYLVMTPVNVQLREGPTESIGSWEYSGLGHENLRELRGAGLLAAWLCWFDSRIDNNKLRIDRDTDGVHLQHFISDLGGGMGSGTGFFSPRGENPNEFAWNFTAPEIFRGPGRMTTPFRIEHFKPTVPTPAFAAMTADDARWMARLIGQLNENQIRAALIASGYDNAEARLYLEKLLSRRDQMIRDLKLEHEIPLLRPNGQDRDFSYVPTTDGPFMAVVGSATVAARQSSAVVFHGILLYQPIDIRQTTAQN